MLRKKPAEQSSNPPKDAPADDADPSGKSKFIPDAPKPSFAEAMVGARNIMNESKNKDVIAKLIRTSIAMLVFPILTYYFFYNIDQFFTSLTVSDTNRSLLGGVAAVLAVQAIVIYYVIGGLTEKDERT